MDFDGEQPRCPECGVEYGRVEIRRVMNGTDTRYKAAHRG